MRRLLSWVQIALASVVWPTMHHHFHRSNMSREKCSHPSQLATPKKPDQSAQHATISYFEPEASGFSHYHPNNDCSKATCASPNLMRHPRRHSSVPSTSLVRPLDCSSNGSNRSSTKEYESIEVPKILTVYRAWTILRRSKRTLEKDHESRNTGIRGVASHKGPGALLRKCSKKKGFQGWDRGVEWTCWMKHKVQKIAPNSPRYAVVASYQCRTEERLYNQQMYPGWKSVPMAVLLSIARSPKAFPSR